jgi:hypothetical protein
MKTLMKIRIFVPLLITVFLLSAFIHCADESSKRPLPTDQGALNRRLLAACSGWILNGNGTYDKTGHNPDEVRDLINARANINYRDEKFPSVTLLHYVCEPIIDQRDGNKQLEVAKILLDTAPGLIDIPDGIGSTPLLIAAHYEASLLTTLFVERGANKNSVDTFGHTAFQIADNYLKGIDSSKSRDTAHPFTPETVKLLYPYSYPLWMYRTQESLMNHQTACIFAAAVCVISAAAGMIYRYSSKSETADTDEANDTDKLQQV